MGLMIVGAILGLFFGWGFLGYYGWSLGAIIGGLAGLLLRQVQKIDRLENTVQALKEEQSHINHQLAELKNTHRDNLVVNDAGLNTQSRADELLATQTMASTTDEPPSSDMNESVVLDLDLPETSLSPRIIQPVVPQAPREPDLGDKLIAAVRRFFTEGNPIVNIGMVIMFFGVSFLVKYAASQGLFPIELRLTGVILGAIALLVFGWKTRQRAGSYGLVLQGGGIAVIYLTLFAAAKIYGLLPSGIAFGLLFCVVVLGVLLALLQNTQTLAILATAGGFLAPILTSTGEGSHVGLFSFYLILNLGILAIALYKAWRLLNWVGFMFTFVITALWGVLKYEPVFYASTQPFLIAFFALYLAVSILFSFRQPTNLKGMVDGSLVFGLPLVAFGLQTALLKHTDYGLAISAIALAVIYLALAGLLSRRYLHSHRVLIESFLALGASFATLAVPLALDASWTSVTWALEATGLVWVGLRQGRLRPRVVGYLLHCAAAFSLVIFDGLNTGLTPIITGDFICLVLLAITSFMIAYLLHLFRGHLRSFEQVVATIALCLGIIWWFVATINELNAHIMGQHLFAATIAFAALSAISLILFSKKLSWQALGKSVFALLPFMALLFFVVYVVNENDAHPTQGFSFLAIVFFLAVQYIFLFDQEKIIQTPNSILLNIWQVVTAWVIFGLIFWEISWQQAHLNLHGVAGLMIWFIALMVPVVALIGATRKKVWPFATYQQEFKNWIPAPLFALSVIWFVAVCNKNPDNPQYIPLFNLLDLAQFAVVLVFAYAAKYHFMDAVGFISTRVRVGFLGVMLFVWLNVVVLRAVSHYQHIPYYFDNLWDAAQVQMALSILWTLCALVIMNTSRKLYSRELWLIGASLLGLVILKLATKDWSDKDTLAGIISFMVVGIIILLIGYLSPIPAKSKSLDKQEAPNEEGDTNA